ncbi:hypothetical protein ACT33J_001076 [Vibrio fluvialis]
MSDQTTYQEDSLELLDALEIGFDLSEYESAREEINDDFCLL